LKISLEEAKTSHIHGLAELIFENSVLLKEIYKFNGIPIKMLMTFFIKIEEVIQFHMEAQKTQNSQSNLKEKEQCWRYHND
jgi:hypothetical protein